MRPLLILAGVLALAACQPSAEKKAETAEAAQSAQITEAASTDEAATPCAADIGQDKAQALVDRCIQVSAATHPPCNVANPCAMIQGEIDRSCALFDDGEHPPACTA